MKKINYLSNRRLLTEIHHSKMSFSWYESDHSYYFDYAVPFTKLDATAKDVEDAKNKNLEPTVYRISEITDDIVENAIVQRADRLSKKRYDEAEMQWSKTKTGEKPIKSDFVVNPEDFSKEDVVIRVMTYEHIPLCPERKKTPKKIADLFAKCNFPPFKHYVWRNGQWTEVARSHWLGDLETGGFSTKHGRMTEALGAMMIRFCQKYGTKGNWRSYSYADEMMSDTLMQMTDAGLRYCESRGNNPFSYYTTMAKNQFTRVFNQEKKGHNHRDDLLELNGLEPSHTRQLDNELHQYAQRYKKLNE